MVMQKFPSLRGSQIASEMSKSVRAPSGAATSSDFVALSLKPARAHRDVDMRMAPVHVTKEVPLSFLSSACRQVDHRWQKART